MKIRKINIVLVFFLGAILAFTGCKKDDGPTPNRVTIHEVPVISTAIDPTGSQSIDLLNLAAFSGKFSVKLYFDGAVPPTKVDIVVRKNGSNTNVKLYKADVTSLPVSYTINAAELATLFGAAIALGDTYDFAPDIYSNGKKWEAFPAVATGTGVGVRAAPLYSELAQFKAICAYDTNIYQGDFAVVEDAWADFSVGETVTITRLNNTQFSFIDPYAAAPRLPIIVTVNVGNNQATVPKTSVGSAWTWAVGTYTGAFVGTGGAATASFVSPCDKSVTLALNYMVDAGTFGGGPYKLVLRKKP